MIRGGEASMEYYWGRCGHCRSLRFIVNDACTSCGYTVHRSVRSRIRAVLDHLMAGGHQKL